MTRPLPITFAPDVEPFEPKPLIADLLRTRFCIPGSIFLVESVESLALPRSSRWRAVRLLLGDGELCIQALLRPEMHRFVDLATVRLGCYVRLDRFQLFREDSAVERKPMVYLVVHDVETVGWNMALCEPDEPYNADETMAQARRENDKAPIQREQDAHTRDRNVASGSPTRPTHVKEGTGKSMRQTQKPPDEEEDFILDSDADDLLDMAEAVAQAQDKKVERFPSPDRGVHNVTVQPTESESARLEGHVRREPGRGSESKTSSRGNDQSGNGSRGNDHSSAKRAAASRSPPSRKPDQPAHQPPRRQPAAPVALPRDWTHPSIPLKLTPLCSIPHLPYKQNWSINVLAIVVSLSEVEPFRFPPYSCRRARLVDPSTPKQIMLTVFLDPDEFRPTLGTPVLLVGVKNHLFDGGSLNKYASDRPPNRSVRWWYPDPSQLPWCEVDALVSWWREQSDKPDDGSIADATTTTTTEHDGTRASKA
ncbi:hypothetical protein ACRALDRAFT_211328 [Sodiomyces alcalophilus JCM 7366]|uniref:uncharacterized protein n=1 Tax=Sodiomyces alcalophilus JCM 7366 TaxID=591952 RepID=UPI0039B62C76